MRLSGQKNHWRFMLVLGYVIVMSNVDRAAASETADLRTWTDSSGHYEVQAIYVGCLSGEVTLRKLDGTEVRVPYKQLGAADQRFVLRQISQKRVAGRQDPARHAKTEEGNEHRESRPDVLIATVDRPALGTKKLYGINWHTTAAGAQAAAEADRGKQKPVMWFRVLGDLEGFL